MSDNIKDILAYAWNGDSENLAAALDAEMQTRISAHIDDLTAQVSSNLFNGTEEQVEEIPQTELEQQEEPEFEGTPEDEIV